MGFGWGLGFGGLEFRVYRRFCLVFFAGGTRHSSLSSFVSISASIRGFIFPLCAFSAFSSSYSPAYAPYVIGELPPVLNVVALLSHFCFVNLFLTRDKAVTITTTLKRIWLATVTCSSVFQQTPRPNKQRHTLVSQLHLAPCRCNL